MRCDVLEMRPEGIYCPGGDFFVDPRGSVPRAVVTHAHSDHARSGHGHYLCANSCKPLLRVRLGASASIESIPYGDSIQIGEATVSFHPAGHILGSAQIRIEVKGEVWVVSGDYKPQADRTCEAFELVKCHGFISECTFGLPVYRWPEEELIHQQVNQWWKANAEDDRPSLIFAYSLGKAQRILAGLESGIGKIFAHSAVCSFLEHYKSAGVDLPSVIKLGDKEKEHFGGSMIVAPPAVEDSRWTQRIRNCRKGFASGWMSIRGARRRRNVDKGFVLSDHADWPGLLEVIKGTEAEVVKLTHGNGDVLARYLQEMGINASVLNESFYVREEES